MIEVPLNHPEISPFLLDHKKVLPHAITEQAQTVPNRLAGHPNRIFVIDDESIIADSLTEILKTNGYEAVAFYNGQSAIESARRRCPDFVLSDVMMPSLNGIDTVIAISKLCRRSRIVLFSGQAGTADLLESARARGYDFELIPKPIHPDRLLRKLANLKKPV
jgi:DNA-binding NtrC family response regulator